jgi:hypothetical protein
MLNNNSSSPTINNGIFWDNVPDQFNNGGTPTINYSDVQGGCPAVASCYRVMNLNPQFVRDPDPGPDFTWGTPDDDYGDLHLREGSPAIDAGNNNLLPNDITDLDEDGITSEPIPYDLDRLPRIYNLTVDMGAYEFQYLLIHLPLALFK